MFYFLAGLPRTGNTLLSSIFNQNPLIYSSPLSPVCQYAWELHKSLVKQEPGINQDQVNGTHYIMQNLLKNFYSDIDSPIIIDRQKWWGIPNNLALLKNYIEPDPKIIFTARPIIEILASFIVNTPIKIRITHMKNEGYIRNLEIPLNDDYCDFLMRPEGYMQYLLLTINEILKPENKNTFCLVEYDSLINNPKETLDRIYKFLNLEPFEHDFNNIKKLEIDDDEKIGLPKDWHKVRKTISKKSRDPKDVLSEYTLNKYSNMENWR
jgi:sulfotransferase